MAGNAAAAAVHPDQVDRVKMECPTCGYKSFPQWMNDKASCLKCSTVLKTRPQTGGGKGLEVPMPAAQARPKSPASKLDTPLAPQPKPASPRPAAETANLRDAQGREKMECPTCGYKSYPQWMNDKAHCLKCDAVLKKRPVGGGGGAALKPPSSASGAERARSKSPMPGVGASIVGSRPASAGGGGGGADAIFNSFAAGKPDMDGKTFAKLCKDCKLICKAFTTTDVDLTFAKVCEKGQRRINVGQFIRALGLIAQKKGVSTEALQSTLASAGGPQFAGTATDAVRFHDDKSTYTGVHTKGGPEQVAKGLGTQ